MSRSSEAFWRKLEAKPTLRGVRKEWEGALGDEFPTLRPFLEPEPGLLDWSPCPLRRDGTCGRNVIPVDDGGFDAVCGKKPRRCETIRVNREDLTSYRFSPSLLTSTLRQVLGLARGMSTIELERATNSSFIGNYTPTAESRFPAYFGVHCEASKITSLLSGITLQETQPYLAVLPTRKSLEPKTSLILRAYGAAAIFLCEITEIDDEGRLRSNGRMEASLTRFRERHISAGQSAFGGPIGNGPQKKRETRATTIDGLKRILDEHLTAAKDYAESTFETEGVPRLLPRPTQRELAEALGVGVASVNRALQDGDRELRMMWEVAVDIDAIRRYRARSRRSVGAATGPKT